MPHTPLALGFAVLAAEGRAPPLHGQAQAADQDRGLSDAACRPPRAVSLEAEIAALAKAGAKIALDPVLAADKLRMLVAENGGAVVAAPIRPAFRAPPRTAPRSPARAPRTAATARQWRSCCAGSTARLPDTLDEIAVVTKLEEMRRVTGEETQMPLRDVSFATIAGAGPNGAIMHYRVSRAHQPAAQRAASCSCSIPAPSTRTARPTSPAPCRSARRPRRCATRYTLVLKGMIGISMLRFPAGVRGVGHRRGGAAGAVEVRPRLRARHRPRRRLLPFGA